MKRVWPVLITLLALLVPTGAAAAGCDETLRNALDKPIEKRLAALEKAERRCPDHAPTLASLGFLYLDMRAAAGEDWVRRSLESFEKALAEEPSMADARWGTAMMLEYAGAYREAAEQYRWLADGPGSETAAPEARWAARVHLATCSFLSSLGEAEAAGEPGGAAVGDLDLSDEGIRARASWKELQKVAAAVGMAGGLGAMGPEYLQVERALGLLEDWQRDPAESPVVRRAALLAGMVDTLAAVAADRGLQEKVAASLATFGPEEAGPWPEPGFSGEMAETYRAADRDPDRSFLIFPNLAVQERWNIPDLSGQWIYRQMAASCTEAVVQTAPASSREVTLEQDRKTATFGTPPFRCVLTRDLMRCGRMEPRRQVATQLNLSCPIAKGLTVIECDFEIQGTIATQDPIANPFQRSQALIGEYSCRGEATLTRVETEPQD
jgi:hypothetical protein